MDYAALKAELSRGVYAGRTDAQIVATLNAATIATDENVVGEDMQDVLQAAGLLGRYTMAARLPPTGTLDAPSDQDIRVARIIEVMEATRTGLRLSRRAQRDRFTALLALMVGSSDMPQAVADALLALRVGTTSRARQAGIAGPVTLGDIATARATIA